jgi:hypothetical protein
MLNLITQVSADELRLGKIVSPGNVGEDLLNDGDVQWGKIVMWGLQIAMTVVLILMLAQIIIGAIGIMSGDKTKMDEGRKKIVFSVVGVLIVASALVILQLVQGAIGVQTINIS